MNLQTQISPELWAAIEETYSANNYSHSIVDAMHYLSNILREKSGLDGDGAALVGAVLGGNTPPLKLNNFQTESERSEQRGIENILRGLYMGIRNPRSHGAIKDDKADADAVICFVDYLIRIINRAEPPFTIHTFVDKVYEPHFAANQRYADLLTEEIPEVKLFDVLIEIFRRKTEGNQNNLPFMLRAIRARLNNEQVRSFLHIVSEDLLRSQNSNEIQATLQMLEPDLWPQIKESSRIRIENMLIESIKTGDLGDVFWNGGLGIWVKKYVQHFSLKQQLSTALARTTHKSINSCRYVLHYFGHLLPKICIEKDADLCIQGIIKFIKVDYRENRGTNIFDLVDRHLASYPASWRLTILNETVDYRPPDDIPF